MHIPIKTHTQNTKKTTKTTSMNSAAEEKNSIYIIHILYLIDYLKLMQVGKTFDRDRDQEKTKKEVLVSME